MIVVLVVIVVVVIGLVAATVSGRIGGSMNEPARTHAMYDLPEGVLRRDDIDAVRFDTVLRGYRMDQVDRVIGRLGDEIADLAQEIRTLREESDAAAPAPAYTRPTSAPSDQPG